jgi:hypothetical protein
LTYVKISFNLKLGVCNLSFILIKYPPDPVKASSHSYKVLLLDIVDSCNLCKATKKRFLIFKIRSVQWDTVTVYTYYPNNRTTFFMIRNENVLSLNTTLFYGRNQPHVSANVGSHPHQFIKFVVNFMKYYSCFMCHVYYTTPPLAGSRFLTKNSALNISFVYFVISLKMANVISRNM